MKKTLSLIALSLVAGGILISQQTAPISGGGALPPIPGQTFPALGSEATTKTFVKAVDPTPSGVCYNVSVLQYNYVNQNLWGCSIPPGSTPGSVPASWQLIAGALGFPANLTTAASATTLVTTSGYVSVTGSTSIATITGPVTPITGTRITLFAATSATWATTTAGNIGAVVAAVTAGNAYPFIWNGTKWSPVV